MRNIYVSLSQEAVSALVDEATRERRHPKDLAALIITEHLQESGALVGGTQHAGTPVATLDDAGGRLEGRLVMYLPPQVAVALRRAATDDHRSARQQAVHVLARALLDGDAKP